MLLKKIIKLSKRGGRSTSLKKYKSAMTVDSVADNREPSTRSNARGTQVVPMTARNYTSQQSFDLREAQ